MRAVRILSSVLFAVVMLALPAMAQNKAAMTKLSGEFYKVSLGLSNSLADLTKRISTASPNDRDMLKLVTSQLGIVNASAEGVLDLGALAGEVRDAGDMAIVKKHLISRCANFKSSAEATAKYMESVSANIAAVATAAEVTKARELLTQLGQHALCSVK